MLRIFVTESEHVEAFCLHIVGDIVGADSIVTGFTPGVAPGEYLCSHIGREL